MREPINEKALPPGWKWVKLGEIAKWGSGGTPKSTNIEYYDGDIPWLTIGDLTDGDVYFSEKKITENGLKNSSAKLLNRECVLIAMYGSIGKLGINKIPLATNQAIAFTEKLNATVSNKFLFFYLFHIRSKLHSIGKGGTQKNISQTVLKQVDFPLPSLPIQQNIVSKIEELFSELDKGVESLKTAQQQLKTYRQSVLKWAFEGKLTREEGRGKREELPMAAEQTEDYLTDLPEGWRWVKLKEIALEITDGDHQPPPKTSTGVPFITISNIDKHTNKIDFSKTFSVSSTYYGKLKNNRKPSIGDILYTVTGSFGIPILIDFEKEFCFQRHVGLIRPLTSVNQRWLYYLLQSQLIYNQAKKTATGTAQKTVALNSLRNFIIPMCPYEEQQTITMAIETRLSVADKMEESIFQSLQQAEALRQSILKRAFEGRLV